MKKSIELYGIVIVVVILLAMMLTYFWSENGFMGEISKTPPSSELNSEDESKWIEDVGGRDKPSLAVKVKSLRKGKTYDLIKEFSMKAINAQGQELPVEIEQITYEDGTTIESKGFKPEKSGVYTVLCSAKEEYQSVLLKTEETYRFMVD